MKSYLISELVAFSVLSDSSNQITAAAAILSVLSDWSIRERWRGELRGATVLGCCGRKRLPRTLAHSHTRFMRLFLDAVQEPVRSAPHHLLAQRLVGRNAFPPRPPLMESIASKPLCLFLRRRDGHLIAEVDSLLLIGLIRPFSFDRARSLLIVLEILHRPVMHPSWGIPSRAASWTAQTSLAVIFAMAFFSFPHCCSLSPVAKKLRPPATIAPLQWSAAMP